MPVNNPRHSRFFWRSPAMFGLLDAERQFKEVNAAWEHTLGLTTGHLLARNFNSFIHPEDRPSSQYYFDQLEAGMASVSFSNRFQDSEGNYKQILWQVNTAASQDYAYYLVGIDITGREQPMVADEMLSVLQEGVVLQYANGTIGACNPSAEKILGLPADQMMGWTLIDPDWHMIHEDSSPLPAETHPAICTLRTGQPFSDVVIGVVKTDATTTWIRVNTYPLWRDDVTTPYAVVISFSDITRYMETQKGQAPSQEQPVNISEYDLWDWHLEDNTVTFSSSWKRMLGFDDKELPDHIDSWHQRIHLSDYKRVIADIQNHLDGLTQVCENTHRIQHKNGSYRWVNCRAVVIRDANNKPERMVGTHVDVTEPRRLEEDLHETEKMFRQLMELESDGILLVDVETLDILDANKAAATMYGYSRNQLLTMKKTDLSAQPDKTEASIRKAVKYSSSKFHRRQDESVFPVQIQANAFVWKGKQVMMVTVRDMTEQQRIENALWENEAKYRQLFEASSNATIIFDANTQYVFDVNRAAIDLYGYSKEEWVHMSTEDASAESNKKRAAFASDNKKFQHIPLRWHKKKDGTVFPVEISTGSSYLFQGRSLICATVHDITERKSHEEEIRRERDFVTTLVQASPAFFFAINPDGKTRMMNNAMLNALEYEIDEVVETDYLSTFVPEDERSIVSSEFEGLVKTMQPTLMESHVLTKSNKHLLLEWHARAIVKANGALDYLFAVGIDVTERRKAQGHLRLFKSIIEASQESIVISDPKGNLIYLNPAYERLFGRSLQETSNLRDFYPAQSLESLESSIMQAITEGESWEGELELIDQDDNLIPVWQRVDALRDGHGEISYVFALMHDISERQRMWQTLRKQWEEHQMIFNHVPAMIWYRDSDNKLLRANKLAEETFGRGDSLAKQYTSCEEVIQLGRAVSGVVLQYRGVHGDTGWMQLDKIPYRDSQGNLTGVIVFAIDMTDYKQTQVSLQASEERMYLAVENMPVMLVAFDREGSIVVWNRTCEEVTSFSSEDIVNNHKALQLLFPDAGDRRRMMSKWHTLDEGQNYWETRIACKDGHLKTIAWTSVCKQYPIPGWHAWHIGQDITTSRKVEHSFREAEALLASVIELSKLGVCLMDDRGRFIQVNRAFADLYGYHPDEMIGEPFTITLPPAVHNDAVRQYYSLLMTQEEPTLIKWQNEQHRNGRLFGMQIMSSRVILEDRRRLLLSIVSPWEEANR